MSKRITSSQRSAFFRFFQAAWANHAREIGADPDDAAAREAYRRQLIREECGVNSLTQVSRCKGYDKLLQRVCMEAEAYAVAADVELSAMRRVRARAEDCLRQICEIEGASYLETALARWHYIGGILKHAYQGRDWPDIPEEDSENVFRMLDTYRRRLLRRAGWGAVRGDVTRPMGYQYGRRYQRTTSGVVWYDFPLNEKEALHAG